MKISEVVGTIRRGLHIIPAIRRRAEAKAKAKIERRLALRKAKKAAESRRRAEARAEARRLLKLKARAARAPRSTFGEILMVDPARVWRAAMGGISDERRPPDVRKAWRGAAVSVMDGDWDNGAWGTSVENLYSLKAIEEMRRHFAAGKPWEKTAYFRSLARKVRKGKVVMRRIGGGERDFVSNDAEIRRHLHHYDAIFQSIAENGYKTQAELGRPGSLDEIRIGIDRHGHLIALGGRHRLAMVQILNLPAVPMRLVVRHAQWDAFRREIERNARERWEGKVYQKLSHPDLAHLPGAHEEHKRVGLIRKALAGRKWEGKRLIDLGTHWGYWPEQMEKLGFDCVGVELRKEDAEIAEKLKVANDCRYSIWQGELTRYPDPKADVVLALSIFHHLVGKEESHARLIDFLHRLETKIMFFEPPTKNIVRYRPEEFVRFVSNHARLPNVLQLGVTNKRPLYMLTR